jgi:hypothetical protein
MDRVSSVIRSNGLEMFNCVAVSAGSNVGSEINPLELVLRLLETHVEVTPAERMESRFGHCTPTWLTGFRLLPASPFLVQ